MTSQCHHMLKKYYYFIMVLCKAKINTIFHSEMLERAVQPHGTL